MSKTPLTILVTGGNKGIGFEICRQLAQAGHHVILSARSAQRGREAVAALEKEKLKVEFLVLDMADEGSIQAGSDALKKKHKALHVLINNAAILPTWSGSILNSDAAEFRDTFNINTLGPILLTLALIPLLEAGKPSRIINVSSQLGSVENMGDGWAGYGVSKAALNAATRKFATALQPRGISVNAASPGWVKTDMGTDSAPLSVEQGAKNIIRLIDMPHSVTNSYLEANGEIPW